ncbi:MAG: 50S ribosomal protein L18 [Deltaproteobacteria bacterium]|nr:50S ribosomal protein L18 [Deltaproteobacteria bacterium]
MQQQVTGRARRKRRIRKKVSGSPSRPRLSVFRSARHIYAQVIDDSTGTTIASASSMVEAKDSTEASKVELAQKVGAAVAKACADKGVEEVVFDRNGFMYHGRVRALADAAREAGLRF